MKRNIHFVSVLLIICMAVAGCGAAPPTTAAKNEFFVRNVIDGDTIELTNRKRVRYMGIDTPESRKRIRGAWQYAPEKYAEEAKQYNGSLVFRKKVRLEFGGEKEDKYGRWLAYVYVDGIMVNAELLKKGYATVYTFRPYVEHIDILMKAQEEAIKSKRGLWSKYDTISARDAAANIDKFIAVKGDVVDVYRYKNAVNLTLSEGLRVVIFNPNLVFFEKKGIIPSRHYMGKLIKVVGKIRDYNGPEIVVSSPSQITIIE